MARRTVYARKVADGSKGDSFDASSRAWASPRAPIATVWQRDGWARVADAVAGEEGAFVDWARDHRRWRFVVAEAAEAVCAKPREAASWILHAIIDDLLDEDD